MPNSRQYHVWYSILHEQPEYRGLATSCRPTAMKWFDDGWWNVGSNPHDAAVNTRNLSSFPGEAIHPSNLPKRVAFQDL